MTIKDLSRKQIIVSINNDNKKNFMKESSSHVTNMNSTLKNIKSDVMVDFVQVNPRSIIIVTNKVASSLDLQTIENCVKNTNYINTERVNILRLPQSKSYLKIIGILYLQEDMLTSITLSVVEEIIKRNHIFNNVILVLKPHIIKISPKLDIAIIWVDIWNV